MNELSVAWVLHTRPYKERSVIAEFLVEDYGRVAMVVRSVRQAKSKTAPLLQPFTKVLVSWRGRGELKTLVSIESSASIKLRGKSLFCGFYINELLLRSTMPGQDIEGLIGLYEWVVGKLVEDLPIEPLLRLFEIELLELSGYAPTLRFDASSGSPIVAEQIYHFQLDKGFFPVVHTIERERPFYYKGAVLLALADRDLSQSDYYPAFKRFTRQALVSLIGNKPLQSRELFSKTRVPG